MEIKLHIDVVEEALCFGWIDVWILKTVVS